MARQAAVVLVLAVAMVAVGWWPRRPPQAVTQPLGPGAAAMTQPRQPALPAHFPGVETERSGPSADRRADPLLAPSLRYTLEGLLSQAGDASDPSLRKQRLAGLVGTHFPTDFAARALALAERYVDYRVALGQLRAPQDTTDLRAALEAQQEIRLRFFDEAEYAALFAREVELERYTLARLEIARNAQLTAEQRGRALQATQQLLPKERVAERNTAIEHMAAAAQTAAFNAQNTDAAARHAARSAQYGEAAAHALAELDREEQSWQQRLARYSQALAQPGHSQQLFSPEELPRVDAALAWRMQSTAVAPKDGWQSGQDAAGGAAK